MPKSNVLRFEVPRQRDVLPCGTPLLPGNSFLAGAEYARKQTNVSRIRRSAFVEGALVASIIWLALFCLYMAAVS